MKRCMIFLLALLMAAAGGTMTAMAYDVPSILYVGIFYGASAQKSVTLESSTGFYIGTFADRNFVSQQASDNTVLTVRPGDGGLIQVLGPEGTVIYTGENGTGITSRASDRMEDIITINGSQYRGGFQFQRSGESLTVINAVEMEQYLYGVISREMSPSWNVEALKAQAVCARNYAANSLNKHSDNGFDVCNGVHCQAYSGVKAEEATSYAPVDQTRGQVLTYAGGLAQLYYSASMGPTTEDVQYVWGNTVPYLVSVDNSYEDTANIPNGIWTATLTREEATTIMRNKGYDVGDVTSIKAIEYSPNGRVTKLQVVGTTATKTFERESCRTIFNNVTKSQMFTVTGDGEAAAMPEIMITDGNSDVSKKINAVVMLSKVGSSILSSEKLYATNGVYQKTYTKGEGTGTNSVFTFTGQGWGHGVGMSQYGAKGMAEAGFTFDEILNNYFPGTKLETVY